MWFPDTSVFLHFDCKICFQMTNSRHEDRQTSGFPVLREELENPLLLSTCSFIVKSKQTPAFPAPSPPAKGPPPPSLGDGNV
jgi:hypothetical protein